MSGKALAIAITVATAVLVAIGTLWPGEASGTVYIAGAGTSAFNSNDSPETTVHSLFDNVRQHNWSRAYSYLGNQNEVDQRDFEADLQGTNDSLRTYSTLEPSDFRVLHQSSDTAVVRANLKWATAVGAFYETRDLNLTRQGNGWKVIWPSGKQPNVPPQVIPVNYLRWDVIFRGPGDDWGAQNVEAPHVRITSMKAGDSGDSVIIMGEILNEDTVPAFVDVKATLIGNDGNSLGKENSFDKISHTLLPKEVSPFRIDFPGVRLGDVKSVRMEPNSSLVPASADPVIAVEHQQLQVDARGKHVLQGELVNESGRVVNIPHVIATYYNNQGQVIWVADGYVDRALLPGFPMPFGVAVPDELASQVHNYRVIVNQYSQGKFLQ